MLTSFIHPKNLSQKLMRVIFSIYLGVSALVTGIQFFTEYAKTQDSIQSELVQLEQTVRDPIATSLWQYNQKQLDSLVAGLLKMPIIVGVDILDKNAKVLVSSRSYSDGAAPLSLFATETELSWQLNGSQIRLGTLKLYSSSEVVLDRVLFGFALIAITAIIKLSVLFFLFIWALDRFLARPLKELMSQVDEVQLGDRGRERINLSVVEENEISKLQSHMNKMLCSMENGRKKLLQDEQGKRAWLEDAVAKRTEELQVLNDKLRELAAYDSLTGALNRGNFFETARHLLAQPQSQKSAASFILMDLDYFKFINDTYGHFVGDQVLVHFTRAVQAHLRKGDLLGRLGGEEFAVFLPDLGIEEAVALADRLRQSIGEARLVIDGQSITYTVSLGVSSSGYGDKSVEELFKLADVKLYGAKEKGRDRVEM
ncbi:MULTISPECIES: diguanylate cyclase [Thalassospira]|uniref:diguanylate cyclase n=2 Tax=Thalassospira TaxID=168934 RepID=A0A367WCR1_9PROT|nr:MULTISPECIES: diguanylate cyclase [Thalassospira]MDG4719930.1 diguanylate cyclase [Thalassospira sp. FZY0004]RCK38371.1 diguanylate cyclase [Thalassospira profundimaris]